MIDLIAFLPSAAARALMDSEKSADEIAQRAMQIAADMCVYTNDNFKTEVIKSN